MICLILYCVTATQEVRLCPYFLGKPTQAQEDREVETIAKRGAVIRVCGEEKYVKESVYYRVRFQ